MRKIAISIAIVAAGIAVAATIIVGAKGTGGIVNTAGVKWGFASDVKKMTTDTSNEVRIGGYFNVRREFRDGAHNMLVVVKMPKAERFEAGNELRGAKFSGRAVRILSRDGVVVREDHGVMAVSVHDRREPNGTSVERDLISFTYRPNAGSPNNEGISFSGAVYWGDIDVYRRVE